MYSYTYSAKKPVGYLKAMIMVSSLLIPLIYFLDPRFQTILVFLMRHLHVTISQLKVNRIVYVVSMVETNSIIYMIHDNQLLPSLELNCF